MEQKLNEKILKTYFQLNKNRLQKRKSALCKLQEKFFLRIFLEIEQSLDKNFLPLPF